VLIIESRDFCPSRCFCARTHVHVALRLSSLLHLPINEANAAVPFTLNLCTRQPAQAVLVVPGKADEAQACTVWVETTDAEDKDITFPVSVLRPKVSQ
jgi:hypothetical protein